MSPQEVFDTALMGIRKQGGPGSDSTGMNMFRLRDGRRCAVGMLLLDHEWMHDFIEIREVTRLAPHDALLRAIMFAHDSANQGERVSAEAFLRRFDHLMANVARTHGLRYTAPDGLQILACIGTQGGAWKTTPINWSKFTQHFDLEAVATRSVCKMLMA